MNIELTKSAKKALFDLGITKNRYFRIKIVSGGCSGMTYSAGVDEKMNEDDLLIYDEKQLRVITDFDSVLHLYGLKIDYSDDLIKSGFRFSNPMAQKTCGCGASFSA